MSWPADPRAGPRPRTPGLPQQPHRAAETRPSSNAGDEGGRRLGRCKVEGACTPQPSTPALGPVPWAVPRRVPASQPECPPAAGQMDRCELVHPQSTGRQCRMMPSANHDCGLHSWGCTGVALAGAAQPGPRLLAQTLPSRLMTCPRPAQVRSLSLGPNGFASSQSGGACRDCIHFWALASETCLAPVCE